MAHLGDSGQTDLAGGLRVEKTHPRIECLGALDELNAHLGLVVAQLRTAGDERLEGEAVRLQSVQRLLFGVGAWMAGSEVPQLRERMVEGRELLENEIRLAQREEGCRFRGFVLPGGSVAAAQVHVARTVCRRAERAFWAAASGTTETALAVGAWLNRLSGFLFYLALRLNVWLGTEETAL